MLDLVDKATRVTLSDRAAPTGYEEADEARLNAAFTTFYRALLAKGWTLEHIRAQVRHDERWLDTMPGLAATAEL